MGTERNEALPSAIDLPESPGAFDGATWAEIAPYYEKLAHTSLSTGDPSVTEEWLAAWSRLEEMLAEAGSLAMIAYTGNTADSVAEERYLRFSMEIFPRVEEQQVRLARKLLDVGFEDDALAVTLRRFRTDIEIFREANISRFAAIEELSAAYQKITGGLSVDWDGQSKTIPQLQPFLKAHDRGVRERAFRLGAEAYIAERHRLAELFDKMLTLRHQVARESGFDDFQQYAFRAKHRFDYTPDDCRRFHDAVEAAVSPAVARLMEYRRQKLGVATLRPWDVTVDVTSKHPLVPFRDVAELKSKAQQIFAHVDPVLGEQFATMVDEGLLDLESRPGKAPGGYCTDLPYRKRPFVFMNAVGVPDDVQTLVHEAGHCFHNFATSALPLTWHRQTGHEAAELASMSMELLAMPFLREPIGYYSAEDARSASLEHLEDILGALVHIASVDAFQAWIYTSPDGRDADARDSRWLALRSRFEQGVDWSGLERERIARWYRQLHIFELPFYYIEYGIAQLGALQVFRNSIHDQKAAVRAYRNFLSLGGTRPLPELYRTAGVELIFDVKRMAGLVEFVEERIELLRSGQTDPLAH